MVTVTLPRWTLVVILVSIVAALSFSIGAVYSVRGETHDQTYYACLYAGSLSQVGTTEPANCGRGEVVTWNAVGTEGPEGPPAATFWAIVDGDGDLISGSGVASTSKSAEGAYFVTFDSVVRGCAKVATTGPFTPGEPHGFGVATVRSLLPPGPDIAVLIWDADGVQVDRTFNVAVFC